MSVDIIPIPNSNRNIALLIDADNVSHSGISAMIAELSKYGTANIRRAYGDWTAGNMKGWREKLHEFAIRPIQQFSYTSGKNATDMALVIDALELLYTQNLDAYCIASSDGDFTPLVMHLRANGHDVFGFGERKTPLPFVNACTSFLFIEGLDASSQQHSNSVNSVEGIAKSIQAQNTKTKAVNNAEDLSKDTKLITLLGGAVEACVRDDGWALLSAVAQAAKRQAPIDPRNYNTKNFATLFEQVGQFEIHRAKSGHAYVSDKHNKDRSSTPNQ
jgi:uncharacterized protein (TIGR00288 family)